MKRRLIFLTMAILLASLNSCDKGFLDRNSPNSISGSVIWQSDANATMAVNGIYNSFARGAWRTLFSYLVNVGPLGYTQIRTDWGIAQYSGTAAPQEGIFTTTWTNFYRVIKYANDAIANIPDNPNITPETGKQLVGQARFFRGLGYFYLWSLYGGVPILEQPLNVEDTYLPRNTADEVRQFIIDDFTAAAADLPVSYASSSDVGRATQGAAIAMLGKTYLYAGQWAEASEQLGKLLKPPFSYDLTDNFTDNFFNDTQNNEEQVFYVQYTGILGAGSMMDNQYGYRNHGPIYGEDYSTASNIAVQIYTNKDGSPISLSGIPQEADFGNETDYGTALMNWYQTNYANADPRLHASVILPGSDFNASGGVQRLYWPTGTPTMDPPGIRTTWPNLATLPIRKLVSEGDACPVNRDCSTDFPLIRFAGVLLMYAEAENEVNGPTTAVYDAVNRVRGRAGVNDLPQGLSKDEMRRNIRLELFRELAFETDPYFAVLRWKTASTDDPIFGLNHEIYDFRYVSVLGEKVFRADRDYLWPIPQSARDINNNLEQNPNW